MITLMAYAVGVVVVIDQSARELAADVRLAMKRADLTLDFVSRTIGVPQSRLSDQLNGKTPFTAFWRFWVGEMRDTDFRVEFLEIEARRLDRLLVRADLGALINRLDDLVMNIRMAKAQMPEGQKVEQAS